MLVLTRKPGEVIVIGDNIRLTVVAIGGARVRLGITAPPEIPIHRFELVGAIEPPAKQLSQPPSQPEERR
jgi:carbon storage regulator